MRKTLDPANKSLLTDHDIYLFKEGRHYNLHDKLGAHAAAQGSTNGVMFAVWAPNADSISVVGDFNGWNGEGHSMAPRWDASGIWELFIPGLKTGDKYKYRICSKQNGYCVEKGDPFAVHWETAPRTASIVWDLDYQWNDAAWMSSRHKNNSLKSAMSIYEVHLGSWMRVPEQDNRSLSYRELAPRLAGYVRDMGFTHVELMPVMEHPFFGSWGYQVHGFFAPTSRYGTPQDFMYLVDVLHQHGIGVILDWVPSHFPNDLHGLSFFDGTELFEHADPKLGYHPDWHSLIFNYGRNEVAAFLISSGLNWLGTYHADGLRVDGVASMLYLDYSRKDGEWIPNEFGGRENLQAINLLRNFNAAVYGQFPDVQTFAEESTDWPMVSRPTYVGGLGFGFKWNMGWMHDTLKYMTKEPIHRKFHHNQITFSIWYAFTENFILPLSHDEVVHGKGSLLSSMPGDDWQKRANLRLLYAYMYGHPGKKLLFMGAEIGQWREWNHDSSLDWHLLDFPDHAGIKLFVRDLNHLYKQEPALFEKDYDNEGFYWVDCNDGDTSVLTFVRQAAHGEMILVALNFTPVPRDGYRVGVNTPGFWKELINSDGWEYGGSGMGNRGGCHTQEIPSHGQAQSLELTIPPLGAVFLKPIIEKAKPG